MRKFKIGDRVRNLEDYIGTDYVSVGDTGVIIEYRGKSDSYYMRMDKDNKVWSVDGEWLELINDTTNTNPFVEIKTIYDQMVEAGFSKNEAFAMILKLIDKSL